MLLVVRHQTNCQRLMVRVRLAQGLVQNLPTHFPLLRLQRLPKPAAIRNRGRGEIHRVCCLLQPYHRAFLRPDEAGVERIPVKALESLDPHPRIHQHLVDLLGTEDGGFCLRERSRSTRQQQKNNQNQSRRHGGFSPPYKVPSGTKSQLLLCAANEYFTTETRRPRRKAFLLAPVGATVA